MAAEVAYGAARPAGAPAAPARHPGARPSLRLAPPPARRHGRAASTSRREVVYALTLGLVLGVGVLGVLVLNTLMQQQARTIATQQAGLAALALRTQTVQLQLDALDNPRELARRAQALHMRPAGMLAPLRPAPASAKPKVAKPKPRVSAPVRGTRPAHGG